jgi:hypothetical protein
MRIKEHKVTKFRGSLGFQGKGLNAVTLCLIHFPSIFNSEMYLVFILYFSDSVNTLWIQLYVFYEPAWFSDCYGTKGLGSITGTGREMPLRYQFQANSGAQPASYPIFTGKSFAGARNMKLNTNGQLIQSIECELLPQTSHLNETAVWCRFRRVYYISFNYWVSCEGLLILTAEFTPKFAATSETSSIK